LVFVAAMRSKSFDGGMCLACKMAKSFIGGVWVASVARHFVQGVILFERCMGSRHFDLSFLGDSGPV